MNEGRRLNSEHIFVSAISEQLSNFGIPAKYVLAVAKTNDNVTATESLAKLQNIEL